MADEPTIPDGASEATAGSKSAGASAEDRFVQRFYLWIGIVAIIPYLIYGIAEGSFAATFRSGGASLFICLTLAAALGESIVSIVDRAFSHEPIGPLDTDLVLGAYLIAAGMFAWNMYFAVADKTVRIPTVDWVQIPAFVLGLIYAGVARWATEKGPLEPLAA